MKLKGQFFGVWVQVEFESSWHYFLFVSFLHKCFQCKFSIITEEGWYGQPKYSTLLKAFYVVSTLAFFFNITVFFPLGISRPSSGNWDPFLFKNIGILACNMDLRILFISLWSKNYGPNEEKRRETVEKCHY